MGHCGGQIQETKATEDPEMILIRWDAEEESEGSQVAPWPAWAPIEEICGGSERVRPEVGG